MRYDRRPSRQFHHVVYTKTQALHSHLHSKPQECSSSLPARNPEPLSQHCGAQTDMLCTTVALRKSSIRILIHGLRGWSCLGQLMQQSAGSWLSPDGVCLCVLNPAGTQREPQEQPSSLCGGEGVETVSSRWEALESRRCSLGASKVAKDQTNSIMVQLLDITFLILKL